MFLKLTETQSYLAHVGLLRFPGQALLILDLLACYSHFYALTPNRLDRGCHSAVSLTVAGTVLYRLIDAVA